MVLRAARGHFELVQMVLEAAVMSEGPERAKRLCIDHTNAKKQSALMVACKHGCVVWAGAARISFNCVAEAYRMFLARARLRSTNAAVTGTLPSHPSRGSPLDIRHTLHKH